MFTSIYQVKKIKYNSDKNNNIIPDDIQNNNQKEKLIAYNDSNKEINSNTYKTQPIKKQYINYEPINNSSKERYLKPYEIESKNKEQYFSSHINHLQNNFNEKKNINNNTFKSKANSGNFETPNNYIFGTDSKNKYAKKGIYFNKNIPIKISEKFNKEDNIELSKSSSNFNTPYSFSSVNLGGKALNNNDMNPDLKNLDNLNYNNPNCYIKGRNNLVNSHKEFKSHTQIEGNKIEIKINKNSGIFSKPKQSVNNTNINSNNNNINMMRTKSAKDKLNYYNSYNINYDENGSNISDKNMNKKNNKIIQLKEYYDDERKMQFNQNVNSNSSHMNKDYLYKTINKKKKNMSVDLYKKGRINNIKVYNSNVYKKEKIKRNESQNNHIKTGINYNNDIGKENNNYIIDNNIIIGYNTYNGSFMPKSKNLTINSKDSFNGNEIFESNNTNQRNIINGNKNQIQNYINKRNKSENPKTETDQKAYIKNNKSNSIYINSNKKNKILKNNYNTFDEKRLNYELSSYNSQKDNDNYIIMVPNNNNNKNPKNVQDNYFSRTTYIKKNNMNNIKKFKEYFTDNDDRLNNLNDNKSLKKYNSNTNSLSKFQKNISNQIYISKNNYVKSEKFINKSKKGEYDFKGNNLQLKSQLDFISNRVINLLGTYSFLLEDTYDKSK